MSGLSADEKRKALSEVSTIDESTAKCLDRLSNKEQLELMSNLEKWDVERVTLGLAVADKEKGWDMPAVENYFKLYLALRVSLPAKRHGAGRETLRDAVAGQIEKQSFRQKMGAAIGGFISGGQ